MGAAVAVAVSVASNSASIDKTMERDMRPPWLAPVGSRIFFGVEYRQPIAAVR
ncbi:hypothetical protein XGA_3616 [Xanthomonas hortorum ATCC 19865]|nr:hypothetical protein XGA_3616 [Xanthomonas hortorum ATCC 19865]